MKYRLKKEAVPYVLEKHATSIYSLDVWESIGIDIKALEKVEPPFITYGHKTSERGATLSGWDSSNGSEFHFTIHFPSTKYHEHDKFSKGRISSDLMDRLQHQINNFYSGYLVNDNNNSEE